MWLPRVRHDWAINTTTLHMYSQGSALKWSWFCYPLQKGPGGDWGQRSTDVKPYPQTPLAHYFLPAIVHTTFSCFKSLLLLPFFSLSPSSPTGDIYLIYSSFLKGVSLSIFTIMNIANLMNSLHTWVAEVIGFTRTWWGVVSLIDQSPTQISQSFVYWAWFQNI